MYKVKTFCPLAILLLCLSGYVHADIFTPRDRYVPTQADQIFSSKTTRGPVHFHIDSIKNEEQKYEISLEYDKSLD